MQPEVERARARRPSPTLERLGATVEPVSLPHTEYAIATYYLSPPPRRRSNLARYDGVRYGLRVAGRRRPRSRCTRRRAPPASAPR